MPIASINYLAVFVAAAAMMVLGTIYYARPLFGNTWARLAGVSPEAMKKGAAPSMIWMAVTALIEAYVLAYFVDYTDATTIIAGAVTGFWLWLGFVATTTLADYVFVGRSKHLYAIQMGFHLVSLLVMGAILAVWV